MPHGESAQEGRSPRQACCKQKKAKATLARGCANSDARTLAASVAKKKKESAKKAAKVAVKERLTEQKSKSDYNAFMKKMERSNGGKKPLLMDRLKKLVEDDKRSWQRTILTWWLLTW